MPDPTLLPHPAAAAADRVPPSALASRSFSVVEWRGSGPRSLHIHHEDDEAWHVLKGVAAGGTVVVPAGVAHTYTAHDARYLLVLTPRLAALIAELKGTPDYGRHPEVYRRYASTVLEPGA